MQFIYEKSKMRNSLYMRNGMISPIKHIIDIATIAYFTRMHWKAYHLHITESSTCHINFMCVACCLLSVAILRCCSYCLFYMNSFQANHLLITESSTCWVNFTCVSCCLLSVAILMTSSVVWCTCHFYYFQKIIMYFWNYSDYMFIYVFLYFVNLF